MSDTANDGRSSATGGGDVHDWGPLVDDLAARRDRALEMGGEDRVERQRSLGKLTVRERLDVLLDPGTWIEYGMLADSMDAAYAGRLMAADGAVTGIGEIEGRRVAVAAYDFTVLAGSMGASVSRRSSGCGSWLSVSGSRWCGSSTRPELASSPTPVRRSPEPATCSVSRSRCAVWCRGGGDARDTARRELRTSRLSRTSFRW